MIKNDKIGTIFEFEGTPTYEIYFDENSMWGVYSFDTNDELPEASIKANIFAKDSNNMAKYAYAVSVIGKTIRLLPGQTYKIKARLSYSEKHNSHNYEIISIQTEAPKTIEQQQIFLESLVTELQAETILNVYPNIVNEVISGEDRVDLSMLSGIGEVTWERIKNKIIENYAMSDLLEILAPIGVSYAKIKRIFSSDSNPQVIKEKFFQNPYVLQNIKGISFSQADKIALNLKPELIDSPQRLMAFVKHYLYQNGESLGHTWVLIASLKHDVLSNIPECGNLFDDMISGEREVGKNLFISDERIGLLSHRIVEESIFKTLVDISQSEPLEISQEEIDFGIDIAQRQQGFKFTEEQIEILTKITKNNFNMITGKAGTGKSTLLRGVVNIYRNYMISTCALSAKASKRIEETTGRPSSTIHRLLGAMGENMFLFNSDHPLGSDLIIVDEASMVNADIFERLITATKHGAKIIMCGDSKQLPPIGFGNVFYDLLQRENDFQVNHLTKILRQAEKSGIIKDANDIREGVSPKEVREFPRKTTTGENEDMIYMFRDDAYEMRDIAVRMFMKSVEQVGVEETFILVPRKNDCVNSTLRINKKLQELVLGEDQPYIEFGKRKYMLGCKIIHRVNDYDKMVFNGEIGYITKITANSRNEATGMVVNFGDREVSYKKNELKDIDYAYALTVHLYQGSEAHTVIGIIDKSHHILLDTTFLYTMITRAKERCLLLAEPYAFKRCIRENKSMGRQTWIGEL